MRTWSLLALTALACSGDTDADTDVADTDTRPGSPTSGRTE
jgi:hypothetical protein